MTGNNVTSQGMVDTSTMDKSVPATPPNLMSNQHQIDTIITLRRTQAKEMLTTLSTMSTQEANECKNRADAPTQALKAYNQQLGTSQFNFNEALDALVTLTDRSQKTVCAEQ